MGRERRRRLGKKTGGASRVGCVVEQMQSTGQPIKVVVSSKDGEKRCRTDMGLLFLT